MKKIQHINSGKCLPGISIFKEYLVFKSIFLLLASVFLISCSNQKGSAELVVKDGYIYDTEGEELFTGTVRDQVLDKTIMYDVVNGVKNGRFKIYFEDGKIEMQGSMKNNQNIGKWSYYYPNGQVESEGLFMNDQAEDLWKWYYKNGNLKEEGIFRNGKRDGEWIMYYENGDVIEKVNFIDGEKIQVQSM